MVKNLVSGPNLARFGPNLVPKSFFRRFYFYWMLEIVASYHFKQFKENLVNWTWENSKKPSFGSDFDPFGPNFAPKSFVVNFICTKC